MRDKKKKRKVVKRFLPKSEYPFIGRFDGMTVMEIQETVRIYVDEDTYLEILPHSSKRGKGMTIMSPGRVLKIVPSTANAVHVLLLEDY